MLHPPSTHTHLTWSWFISAALPVSSSKTSTSANRPTSPTAPRKPLCSLLLPGLAHTGVGFRLFPIRWPWAIIALFASRAVLLALIFLYSNNHDWPSDSHSHCGTFPPTSHTLYSPTWVLTKFRPVGRIKKGVESVEKPVQIAFLAGKIPTPRKSLCLTFPRPKRLSFANNHSNHCHCWTWLWVCQCPFVVACLTLVRYFHLWPFGTVQRSCIIPYI